MLESSEKVEKPRLHHNDLAVLEDELKPECDVLNSLAKAFTASKVNLEMLTEEHLKLVASIATIKAELNGNQTSNRSFSSASSHPILRNSPTESPTRLAIEPTEWNRWETSTNARRFTTAAAVRKFGKILHCNIFDKNFGVYSLVALGSETEICENCTILK